jgi:hypothetical protein
MKKLKVMLFAFICLFTLGIYNVNAQVYVGENDITTDEDQSISIGGGTATWDATNKKLTLNNVNISEDSGQNAIIEFLEDGTLVLVGENTLTNTGDYYGIYASNDLTIEGNGTLTITAKLRSMRIVNNLTINGAKLDLNITNNQSNLYGLEADKITIKNNSNVKVNAKGVAIGANANLTIEDSIIDVKTTSNYHSTILVNEFKGEGTVKIKNSTVKANSTYASLQAVKNATIENSTIDFNGGYYGINMYSDKTNSENGNITISNSKLNILTKSNAFSVNPTISDLGNNSIFVSAKKTGYNLSTADTTTDLSKYLSVIIAPAKYTLSVKTDDNSSSDVEKMLLPEGGVKYITFTINDGYLIDKILVNDKEVEANSSNKIAVQANSDVNVVLTTKDKVSIESQEIDTTKEIKEVEVGIATDNTTLETFKTALKNKNIAIEDNTIIDVDIKNIDTKEIATDTIKSINTLIDTKKMILDSYFDITINVLKNNQILNTLTELDNKITFQIALPTDLINTNTKIKRTYYIIRYHDGESEVLTTKTIKNNLLQFSSDKFSTYALAYIDEAVKDSKTTTNPDTSDNILIYVITSIVCLSGVLSIGIAYKKRFN